MKEAKILAVLLILLMGTSLYVAHRDPESSETVHRLIDLNGESITRLHWATQTATLSITPEPNGNQTHYWFDLERSQQKLRFLGNLQVEKFLKNFDKLNASRNLGEGPKHTVTQLDKPKRLTISTKQQKAQLWVGGPTRNKQALYAQPEHSGPVYLVPSALFSQLDDAQRHFMLRKPRPSPLQEVAQIRVNTKDRTLSIQQHNRLSPRDRFWTFNTEGGSDKPDEEAAALASQLEQLTILEYVDGNGFDASEVMFEIIWLDDKNQELGRMSLRDPDPKLKRDFWGQTSFHSATFRIARSNANPALRNIEQLAREPR